MTGANPFEFGPHTEQQWRSRLSATERALGPYIELLLPSLRERILQPGGAVEGLEDERELIIDELHRYRHFLARKPVKDKLQVIEKRNICLNISVHFLIGQGNLSLNLRVSMII